MPEGSGTAGPGSRVLASRPYRALDTARRYATTSLQDLRDPGRFRTVETLCLFVGHVKSGGTLLGALLDAHPNAVVADEIEAIGRDLSGSRGGGYSRPQPASPVKHSSSSHSPR